MQQSDPHLDNRKKSMVWKQILTDGSCVLCHNRQNVWKQPGLTKEMFICRISFSSSVLDSQY